MTAMSYFADLGHAIVHVGTAAFLLAVGIIILWTCAGFGERHLRRVEHRKEMARAARWRQREGRARVVHINEHRAAERSLRSRSAPANDRVNQW